MYYFGTVLSPAGRHGVVLNAPDMENAYLQLANLTRTRFGLEHEGEKLVCGPMEDVVVGGVAVLVEL